MTKICIKKGLSTGKNFDLLSGADLTKEEDAKLLFSYIRRHRPLVIIMGPPCTAFANWSRFNRVAHPVAYGEIRSIGLKLANLTASIAAEQLAEGIADELGIGDVVAEAPVCVAAEANGGTLRDRHKWLEV